MPRLLLPTRLLMMDQNRKVGRTLAVLLVWLWLGIACMAQQFPYVAYVIEPDTYVRSGPGQRYYPTQQLPQGFALEVYRHDGDQWCAVRPPEGSFSWIASHQVRLIEEGVAEVVAERAIARVGSTLSPTRSAVQVLLQRGERVEVFGAQPTDDPRWLRIIAPAGAFRWVSAEQLSRQPPMEATPPRSSVSDWRAQPSNFSSQESLASPSAASVAKATSFEHLSEPRVEANGTSSPQALPNEAGFVAPTTPWPGANEPASSNDTQSLDVIAGSPAEFQLTQFQPDSGTLPPPALLDQSSLPTSPAAAATALPSSPPAPGSSQPRIRFRGMTATPGPMAPRVDELQLRLSQTVVRPRGEWNFDQLRSEATNLLNQEESPRVREQLRDVLDRIARFEQVRGRYADAPLKRANPPQAIDSPDKDLAVSFTGLTENVRQRVRQDLEGGADLENPLAPRKEAEKALYDAVGLLKPVVSRRDKAPQYALVDDRGDVVSFVTPTPDLNLQPYLGRRIGVHGKRGFMPEYRRAHVTAGRVTPIEDRILR